MPERRLEALVLSSRPLGETDRLLTVLSDAEGITRLAVPGGRRPRSSLAAAVPLAHLSLQVGGRDGSLARVRQLCVQRSHSQLGERLETLAAAQLLGELALAVVPSGEPVAGLLADLLMQLGRLDELVRNHGPTDEALAIGVQGSVHQLALGGYALPLAQCARSGVRLEPPIGDWDWRCSLMPSEGLVIGSLAGSRMVLNASELALLQRLLRPSLPRRRDGELLGPQRVWLRLLDLVETWCREHLGRSPRAAALLRVSCGTRASWPVDRAASGP
ncbi:MAG: DNA repair protein RecO C-terminal domain-containing protein [Cyanobacteriota bacterium]|nr:DNA repair protein RecO C-terminal domain-containing protein [Cyanobacteriota bacterium]